jgi:hypothetical protein
MIPSTIFLLISVYGHVQFMIPMKDGDACDLNKGVFLSMLRTGVSVECFDIASQTYNEGKNRRGERPFRFEFEMPDRQNLPSMPGQGFPPGMPEFRTIPGPGFVDPHKGEEKVD